MFKEKIEFIKSKLKDKEYMKTQTKAFFKDLLDMVVFVLIAVTVIRFFIGELRLIPSESMVPTIIPKDRVVVDRVSRFFRTPARGEIMVFYPPSTELKYNPWALFKRYTGIGCDDIAYIKRVIGLPHDKIEIAEANDGSYNVLINDIPLDEPYIYDKFDYLPCTENMYCGPMTLGDDEYFMMGDNRGNSKDSRYWGTIKKDRFIGRAVLLFWPLNRIILFTHPDYSELNK